MAEPAPGDPRNAQYFETLAQLEHGYQHSLAEGAEARQRTKTNAEYATGQIAKAEPEGFRNTRNRANSEGLLQSGVLAGRTGNLASTYGARRYAVTHGQQETEGRITRGEQAAKERYELGQHNAATRALEEGKKWLEENPAAAQDIAGSPGGKLPGPATATTAPRPRIDPRNPAVDLDLSGHYQPSTAPVTRASERAGGVVPYRRGNVRVGEPRVRRAAAKRMFTGGTKAP